MQSVDKQTFGFHPNESAKHNRFPAIRAKPLNVQMTGLGALGVMSPSVRGRRSSYRPPNFPGRSGGSGMCLSGSNGSLKRSLSPTDSTRQERTKATSGLTSHQKRIIEIHA